MLRSRTIQGALIGAFLSALGSVGATVVGVVLQSGAARADDPAPLVRSSKSRPAGACVVLDDAVLRFVARYPDVARRYARPGNAKGIPALATRKQIAMCGNPERLVEAVYR